MYYKKRHSLNTESCTRNCAKKYVKIIIILNQENILKTFILKDYNKKTICEQYKWPHPRKMFFNNINMHDNNIFNLPVYLPRSKSVTNHCTKSLIDEQTNIKTEENYIITPNKTFYNPENINTRYHSNSSKKTCLSERETSRMINKEFLRQKLITKFQKVYEMNIPRSKSALKSMNYEKVENSCNKTRNQIHNPAEQSTIDCICPWCENKEIMSKNREKLIKEKEKQDEHNKAIRKMMEKSIEEEKAKIRNNKKYLNEQIRTSEFNRLQYKK